MIVYNKTKREFLKDVEDNCIDEIIESYFLNTLRHKTGKAEKRSWMSSLTLFANVLRQTNIPNDVKIAVEYCLNMCNNRIDLLVAGQNKLENKSELILIELKQWEQAEISDKDGLVITYINGGLRETTHPSYQVLGYQSLLKNYVKYVQDNEEKINITPLVYLHNMKKENTALLDSRYELYYEKANLYFKNDTQYLRNTIDTLIDYGDVNNLINKIENSELKVSKEIKKELVKIFNNNDKFFLIDDQKILCEKIINLAENSARDKEKRVMIIKGGPGTGKTLVALKSMAYLLSKSSENIFTVFVSKNASLRAVYKNELTSKKSQKFKIKEYDALFKGSSAFTELIENKYGCIIVDEAQRLNMRSQYKASIYENQVRDIISESRFSVFFLDEKQIITTKDIGTENEIINQALKHGIKKENIYNNFELSSQFRTSGSNNYLDFLDSILYNDFSIPSNRKFLNYYDLKVFDNIEEMEKELANKNLGFKVKSKIVAGYCWPWKSKKDENLFDIEIGKFKKKWNLAKDIDWIAKNDTFDQIGCIHTAQGLEIDYMGVIIGKDLIYDEKNGIMTDKSLHPKNDTSVHWNKRLSKKEYNLLCDKIIRNIYRVLLTRGKKGTYIYCCDESLKIYLKNVLGLS